VVDACLFWQVWLFFSKHPPLDVEEYYEAGITSRLFYVRGRPGMAAAVGWAAQGNVAGE
jgi:hypothetical protein